MTESSISDYWCYACSMIVTPEIEDEIKCPNCHGGFVEEMDGSNRDHDLDENGFDRGFPFYASFMLAMMETIRGRNRRDEQTQSEADESTLQDDPDLDWESTHITRRRRRRREYLRLLQDMESRLESSSSENDREDDLMMLINSLNQALVLHIGDDSYQNESNRSMAFDDYFLGSSLDALLQHLEENDPNTYGTPPAQREAIEAMPTVTIEDNLQCPVCLEDFEFGSRARQMPCRHKYHEGCILPWLESHSSCPVCRSQMPSESLKDSSGE